MYLAYLDDSKSKNKKWRVMAGIIIEDKIFNRLDLIVSVIRDVLKSAGKLQDFKEFHACELYGGYGPFDGVDQVLRFDAIRKLVKILNIAHLPVVYGAVNMTALSQEIYGSADPMDMSFRMCCKGVEHHVMQSILKRSGISDLTSLDPKELADRILGAGYMNELALLIVDDCDKAVKNSIQQSYRGLRPQRIFPGFEKIATMLHGNMFHFHDDMYFGDSIYSIGLQLADLCAYFIGQHLGGDAETDSFYQEVHPHIVYSECYPSDEQHPNFSATVLGRLSDGTGSQEV